MKKQLIILSGAIVLALGACNDSTTTTTPATAPGDTTIQKTTTTTTTTTTVHPIANFEHRTFMSVKTGKPVKLRVDTIHHYYVEMETNQQPDYYYFDPVAHDTFDYRGRLLNNALIFNNGNYSIDESGLWIQTMEVPEPQIWKITITAELLPVLPITTASLRSSKRRICTKKKQIILRSRSPMIK